MALFSSKKEICFSDILLKEVARNGLLSVSRILNLYAVTKKDKELLIHHLVDAMNGISDSNSLLFDSCIQLSKNSKTGLVEIETGVK